MAILHSEVARTWQLMVQENPEFVGDFIFTPIGGREKDAISIPIVVNQGGSQGGEFYLNFPRDKSLPFPETAELINLLKNAGRQIWNKEFKVHLFPSQKEK